jgi:hypothetical protein
MGPPKRVIGFALTYFAAVFAIGFALGIVRVLYLVPLIGERSAELAEMPAMMAASVLLAWWLVWRSELDVPSAGAAGVLALALLLGAELAVVVGVRGITLREYLAARDPVGGVAYLAALGVFTLAPAVAAWRAHRSA